MNDPHVVALFYNVKRSSSVDSSEMEPLKHEEEEKFTLTIAHDKACFTMKAHYATEEEARKAVEEYIQVWELDAALQRGPSAFTLEFSHLEIEDRKPTPAAPGELAIGMTAIAGEATVDIGLVVERRDSSYPPPPPSGMKITPDVRSMFARWAGYRLGKEPLASMASFCLTIL